MNFNKVPCGNNIPNDVNVIIEISSRSSFVKYEMHNIYNVLFVDRFLKSSIYYPYDYGYISNTLDVNHKDAIDALVISNFSLLSASVVNTRPVGIFKMFDEDGEDNKIITVPNYNVSDDFNDINDICDVNNSILDKILFFFQNYKLLDKNKSVTIKGWGNVIEAKKVILKGFSLFKKINNII